MIDSSYLQNHHALLRAFLGSFVTHPERLSLTATQEGNGVLWKLSAHADDQPKLIGKHHSHEQALKVIVHRMGDELGLNYDLRLLEPEDIRRTSARLPVIATRYQVQPALALLSRMLEAFRTRTVIGVEHTEGVLPLSYRFVIEAQDKETYIDLTVPDTNGTGSGLTLVAALGTLFRAYGNRDGVRFVLAVVQK